MYPFSTQNDKDFSNLLNVYLDATFFPLLKYTDFKQEAWRTEFTDGKLEYKGVVFNEMKATITDANDFFVHLINKHALAGTTYEFNSGGDPKAIPDLSHEELINFHKKFYHPSNATFLFYGDMDIKKYLNELEEKALDKFDRLEQDTSVNLVKKLSKPLDIEAKFPADEVQVDPESQGKIAISYVIEEMSKDPYTNFCMSVMSSALIDGQNTPMYKALLEARLGKSFISGTGFDASSRESSFTLGLNGIKESNKQIIEDTIYETLKKCMENGIDQKLIDSAIHQIEIRVKQVKSNFGLMVMSSMVPYILHNGDPLTPLYINEFVDRLRNDLHNGIPVFQNLIRDKILNNPHRVTIVGSPDPKFAENIIEEEKARLLKVQESLSEEDKAKLEKEAIELLEDQEAEQDIELLPTLQVSDIDPKIEKIDYAYETSVNNIPVKFIDLPTNGISYVRVKLNAFDLPKRLRPYFPLYSRLINQLGTLNHSHGDFDNLKDLYTVSGVSCSSIITCENDSPDFHTEQLSFRIAFLDRNSDKGFEILSEFLTNIKFDEFDHINNLIQRSVKSRTDDLNSDGMSYGTSVSSASISSASNAYESLRNLRFDCELANNLLLPKVGIQTLNDLSYKLKEIHKILIDKNNMEVLIHTSDMSLKEKYTEKIGEMSFGFKKYIFDDGYLPERFAASFIQEYYTMPMQVNYVIETFKGTSYLNADHAPLVILSEVMTMNMLLREIREKGGAYGAGIKSNTNSGTISLYSYRDPNNLKTYKAFEKCIYDCANGLFEQRNIDEAKLSAFSKIDKPTPAFDKGLGLFFHGITNEMKQISRDRILGVQKSDIMRVAQSYLVEQLENHRSSKVIFGSDSVDRELLSQQKFVVKKPIDITK